MRVIIDYGEDQIDFDIPARNIKGMYIYLADAIAEEVGRENGVLYPSGKTITVTFSSEEDKKFGVRKEIYETIIEDKKQLELLAQDIKGEIDMRVSMYNDPDFESDTY